MAMAAVVLVLLLVHDRMAEWPAWKNAIVCVLCVAMAFGMLEDTVIAVARAIR